MTIEFQHQPRFFGHLEDVLRTEVAGGFEDHWLAHAPYLPKYQIVLQRMSSHPIALAAFFTKDKAHAVKLAYEAVNEHPELSEFRKFGEHAAKALIEWARYNGALPTVESSIAGGPLTEAQQAKVLEHIDQSAQEATNRHSHFEQGGWPQTPWPRLVLEHDGDIVRAMLENEDGESRVVAAMNSTDSIYEAIGRVLLARAMNAPNAPVVIGFAGNVAKKIDRDLRKLGVDVLYRDAPKPVTNLHVLVPPDRRDPTNIYIETRGARVTMTRIARLWNLSEGQIGAFVMALDAELRPLKIILNDKKFADHLRGRDYGRLLAKTELAKTEHLIRDSEI